MTTQPQRRMTVLITGATGAIGSALAKVYASPGSALILQGRNAESLARLEALCTEKGARVITQALDVRDRRALMAWVREISGQETVDLAIVCAGVNGNIGPDRAGEPWQYIEALIEINVLAAIATVDAVLPAMRTRGRGQVALLSSLSAWYGLPITPSYSASKAAIKAYGEALRGWLGPEGIRVNVVMPGYVESKMARDMPGPKAFVIPADRAARYIKRGLERDVPRISFPFPMNLGTWLLSVLPPGVSERILRSLGYRG